LLKRKRKRRWGCTGETDKAQFENLTKSITTEEKQKLPEKYLAGLEEFVFNSARIFKKYNHD
jgi:hypothetical protein